MTPNLSIASHLHSVLEELTALEPLFHAACSDATPTLFESLVAPEFWEIGASGQPYSRAFALSALANRAQPPTDAHWQTSDYHIMDIGGGNYLLTYLLRQQFANQAPRTTRRLTVWQRRGEQWVAVFHQGTVVQQGDKP